MTLKELKKQIAESPNHDWYQNYQINLEFKHINYKQAFPSVVALYEYILKQISGYSSQESLPEQLANSNAVFIRTRDTIINLVNAENIDDSTWSSNLRTFSRPNPPIFPYDCLETTFLLKTHKEKPDFFNGAFEYFSGNTQHATHKAYLNGYIAAYEFSSKDFSLLAERKESEKKSIASIRTDFQNKLSEAETQLTEYLSQANQTYIEYSEKIDKLKKDKEDIYNNWFEDISKKVSEFNLDSSKKMKDFEDLYREKLKLEAPAKYWSDRAKKLRSEGFKWLASLIVCIVIGVIILIWSLNEISNGTLENIFKDAGTAIKWSVVFITLVSFLAFAIRTFAKLTFSSFHLVRDAEEREQLTYVYLALQKEKGIDQTERHLIMQSLFSRADSGLLKDDASPTMPGNVMDQMIKK